MAEGRDDVLSICGSDLEGLPASDFSGFGPDDVSGILPSQPHGEEVSSEKIAV